MAACNGSSSSPTASRFGQLNDIDNGRLIVEIGVAPVRPAEFVIIRIGLWTASRCATC
jgi:phage tail sheath protein FI